MSAFLQSRLRGDAPLETVFWRDMLAWGTALNVVCAAAGLLMLAQEGAGWGAFAVLFAPLPVNIFVFLSVWRSALREGGPAATTAKIVAVVWAVVMIVL